MENQTVFTLWRSWAEWLQTPLGKIVLEHERDHLRSLEGRISGNHVLWVGIPSLPTFPEWHRHQSFFICPDPDVMLSFPDVSRIQGNPETLPFLPESIDIAVLPHTLELVDHPDQLLREIYTVLNPNGHIIIFGFNPWSLWGILRLLHLNKKLPQQAAVHTASRIKDWLEILNFEVIDEGRSFYRPPINHEKLLKSFKFLELVGRHIMCFFGGLYMIVARKKVFGTTPLRLKWEQWVEIVSKGIGEPVHNEGYYHE